MGESVANYLGAVGIRGRVRSMERATFMEAWRTRTRQGVFVTVSAAPGSAAARMEKFVTGGAADTTRGCPRPTHRFPPPTAGGRPRQRARTPAPNPECSAPA